MNIQAIIALVIVVIDTIIFISAGTTISYQKKDGAWLCYLLGILNMLIVIYLAKFN